MKTGVLKFLRIQKLPRPLSFGYRHEGIPPHQFGQHRRIIRPTVLVIIKIFRQYYGNVPQLGRGRLSRAKYPHAKHIDVLRELLLKSSKLPARNSRDFEIRLSGTQRAGTQKKADNPMHRKILNKPD